MWMLGWAGGIDTTFSLAGRDEREGLRVR